MNIEQKVQAMEDRIAIRELIDQYAFCADTREFFCRLEMTPELLPNSMRKHE